MQKREMAKPQDAKEYTAIRILVLAILVAILLPGMPGCAVKWPNVYDSALTYMEEKYGEKFEYVKPWGSSYVTPGARQILVSCESLPDKNILLVINDSEKTYSDNYIDHKFRAQTETFLEDIAHKYFSYVKVNIGIPGFPTVEGIDNETAFDSYIHNERLTLNGSFDIADWQETAAMNMINEFKSQGLHFAFDFVVIKAEEEYYAQYLHDDESVEMKRKVLK
jgi:hypothetical protein